MRINLSSVLGNLAGRVENISHPLLEVRPEEEIPDRRVTADRGLCGAFNSNIIRAAQTFLRERASIRTPQLYAVGRKGRDFFRRRRRSSDLGRIHQFLFASWITGMRRISRTTIVDLYTKAEIDAVYIIYNEFKSVIQQRVVVEKLLPLGLTLRRKLQRTRTPAARLHLRTAAAGDVQPACCRGTWKFRFIARLLESAASEHGARMAAMDTAIE